MARGLSLAVTAALLSGCLAMRETRPLEMGDRAVNRSIEAAVKERLLRSFMEVKLQQRAQGAGGSERALDQTATTKTAKEVRKQGLACAQESAERAGYGVRDRKPACIHVRGSTQLTAGYIPTAIRGKGWIYWLLAGDDCSDMCKKIKDTCNAGQFPHSVKQASEAAASLQDAAIVAALKKFDEEGKKNQDWRNWQDMAEKDRTAQIHLFDAWEAYDSKALTDREKLEYYLTYKKIYEVKTAEMGALIKNAMPKYEKYTPLFEACYKEHYVDSLCGTRTPQLSSKCEKAFEEAVKIPMSIM